MVRLRHRSGAVHRRRRTDSSNTAHPRESGDPDVFRSELLRLHPGEPEERDALHRSYRQHHAASLRASGERGSAQLHGEIPGQAAGPLRGVRRPRGGPRAWAGHEEMAARLQDRADRPVQSGLAGPGAGPSAGM